MSGEDTVCRQLFAMRDEGYKAFQSKLMPNIPPERVIGVRTPQLRTFARTFVGTPQAEAFLRDLPHTYYEENNLHAFLIEQIKDYKQLISELNAFLPHVDNWATCDMMRPKIVKRHLPQLLQQIQVWIHADHPYTIRFGLEMLMVHFLDEAFQPEFLEWAADVRSEAYYVRMMVAWFFATALAKQYDAALPLIQARRLDPWTHYKAIQKAVESNRITKEQKALLRTLKYQA